MQALHIAVLILMSLAMFYAIILQYSMFWNLTKSKYVKTFFSDQLVTDK